MFLFHVLLPLGTTRAMKMHFSRHTPRRGLSLLLKSTRSFHQISWFFSLPIRPCAPCTAATVFHAILQLWHHRVHVGQRTPKYPVPQSKNVWMPENPWGLTPHLGPPMHEEDSPASKIPLWDRIRKKTNFNNQLALKHVQDPPPSLWLRDGGAAVPEGAGCGKAPASISAHIPHLCGISGQGWMEAAFTSAWEKPPEE